MDQEQFAKIFFPLLGQEGTALNQQIVAVITEWKKNTLTKAHDAFLPTMPSPTPDIIRDVAQDALHVQSSNPEMLWMLQMAHLFIERSPSAALDELAKAYKNAEPKID